jgi:hypothetical protein
MELKCKKCGGELERPNNPIMASDDSYAELWLVCMECNAEHSVILTFDKTSLEVHSEEDQE